jgi:hypothetical protein
MNKIITVIIALFFQFQLKVNREEIMKGNAFIGVSQKTKDGL